MLKDIKEIYSKKWGRDDCLMCRRSKTLCFCQKMEPFASNPRFVILLHPREGKKKINTGRMAHLILKNSWLCEGVDFSLDAKLNALLQDPDNDCYLLFPGDNASPLESVSVAAAKNIVFIILDGTWSQARKMYRLSENLQKIPKISFTPNHPSTFRIRKQPAPHCFATIETIDYVLEHFKDKLQSPDNTNLLKGFEYMVASQMNFLKKELTPK